MSLSTWIGFEGVDLAAFVVASLFGYAAGTFVSDLVLSPAVSALVSYHIFLLWLLFGSNHRDGVSLSLFPSILAHMACLIVIVPLSMGRSVIPYFGVIHYGIAGLAVFERGLIFNSSSADRAKTVKAVGPSLPHLDCEDFEAWREYLAQRKPGTHKAGVSIRAEYAQWLKTNAPSRRAASQRSRQPVRR